MGAGQTVFQSRSPCSCDKAGQEVERADMFRSTARLPCARAALQNRVRSDGPGRFCGMILHTASRCCWVTAWDEHRRSIIRQAV